MAAINLNIVTAERPPFVFRSSRTDGGGVWFGYLIELIPLLFQYANLNVTLNYYESPTNEGGSPLSNGSWSGVTGELIAGRADIVAFPLVQAPGRPSVIDLTYSYYESGLGVLVQKEIASTPGTDLFLKPFTPALWLALIATVLGMAIVYHLLSWASPLGEFEVVKVRNVSTNSAVEEFSIDSENESFLLDALMAAMTICAVPRGKSWSIRIPSIAYYFFTMIIVASYTANFASYLTVQSFKYPVNSIEELAARDKLNYVINAGGATESYFEDSVDPTILALRPRLRTVIGNSDGVQAVRDGKYTAYLAETPTLRYFSGQEPCDLQVVGAPFGPSVYTLGVQKNGPYTRAINRAMLQLKQNGLLDELKKKWVDDQNVCTAENSVTNTSLRVKDFSGLWYLLIGVLAFGFLWAIGEVILVRTLAANPALREAFIRMTHHVTNAGKRLDLLSRLSSKRPGESPEEATVTENPAFEPGKEPRFEKSASERNRAFDVFDVAEKDEELGSGFESEVDGQDVDPNKDGLVVLTNSN